MLFPVVVHVKSWNNHARVYLFCFADRLVSDCANATLKAGYEYFGIQFFAQCWSGESNITYDALGKSEKCFARPIT